MKISVLGTGEVGSAVATGLKTLGHDLAFGSRHPGREHNAIPTLSHTDAVERADWIVNALYGEDALELLPTLPLAGKLLIDIGNYRTADEQPIAEPLGEALQRLLPETRVVKTLNFISASLMANPATLSAPHTVFLAGNDPAARADVAKLLESFGWPDIIDLGDITACRAMESLVPLWVNLYRTFGHVDFNIAVVRREPKA